MSAGPDERELLRRLAGASGVNLVLQVGAMAVGLLTSVVLGRLLGAVGLGQYAFGFAVANVLVVLAKLGFDSLLVREIPVAVERRDWGTVRGLVAFSERASISVAVLLGSAALGWSWFFADAEVFFVMAWAIPLLVGMTASTLRSAALSGLQRVVLAQVPVLVVRPVLFLVLLVLVLGPGASAHEAMAAHAAALCVSWAGAAWIWRVVRPADVARAAPVLKARSWLASAAPLVLLGGLFALNTQLDLLMLKSLAGDEQTGVYAVVSQLARTTALVLSVVNGIVAPRYAPLHASGDVAALQRLVAGSAAAVTAATIPAAVALTVLGPYLLSLYGPEFVVGWQALAVLVFANVVNALAGGVGYLLIMTGNDREVALVTAATIVLNALLNLALVPELGMLGAAIGSGVAMVVWNVVLAFRVRALLGIHSSAIGWLLARRKP